MSTLGARLTALRARRVVSN